MWFWQTILSEYFPSITFPFFSLFSPFLTHFPFSYTKKKTNFTSTLLQQNISFSAISNEINWLNYSIWAVVAFKLHWFFEIRVPGNILPWTTPAIQDTNRNRKVHFSKHQSTLFPDCIMSGREDFGLFITLVPKVL